MRASRKTQWRGRRHARWRVRCALSSSAAAALLAAIVSAAHAEPDMPYRQRTVRAARAEGPISIDGVLDEPAWRAAEIGTGFLQTEPDDGDPATADTRFRVLWDDDSLYVG